MAQWSSKVPFTLVRSWRLSSKTPPLRLLVLLNLLKYCLTTLTQMSFSVPMIPRCFGCPSFILLIVLTCSES
ncbi:hypothetical protein EDB87DRAFT_1627103 [Lactarius vividus]|nr:hypothetical protein EDB87DRAFT_1627103 [Lactarius vividus]